VNKGQWGTEDGDEAAKLLLKRQHKKAINPSLNYKE